MINNLCLQDSHFPTNYCNYCGEMELATLWKMEMQYYGKITCNFVEKVLAKNILGGLVHDIGKVYIDNSIIYKFDKLTDKEYQEVKKHCDYGEKILSRYYNLKHLLPIVKYHHERFDGKGYFGLKGYNIPLEARIICIADSFDAMVSKRCYKEKLTLSTARAELIRCSGTQFDPYLVGHFIESLRRISRNDYYDITVFKYLGEDTVLNFAEEPYLPL